MLVAAQEVEDALVGFVQAQDQVKFLTESVTTSKRAVDISLIQYRDGAVDYQRVLDSQKFLVQQQDRLTSARGDVALNLVAAYKALGGGWQIRQEREFIPIETQEEMDNRTDWGKLFTPSSLDLPPPANTADGE